MHITDTDEEFLRNGDTPSDVLSLNDNSYISIPKSPKTKAKAERKLVIKINLIVLPFLAVIMFLQQIDKSLLNYTGVLGIYQDTGITHDQFGWLGSVLYVGVLAMLIPTGFILQRFPPGKVMGITMLLWGTVLTCMMACTNFPELVACRLLLGMCEAAVIPAAFMLIKILYRRSDQIFYIGFCYTTMTAAVTIGSLITYGFGSIGNARGISAWKWCTLIWGLITILASISATFFLPDDPYSKRFRLTPEQKELVDERVQDSAVMRRTLIRWGHIHEALREPRFYCQFLIGFCASMPMGCIGVFSSQIIQEMGYSNLNSILLNMPRGLYDMITFVGFARLVQSTRLKHHVAYTIAGFSVIPLVGMILLCSIDSSEGRLVGLIFSPTNFATAGTQALISSNVSGYTKMIFYTTSNMIAITLGHFVGPLILLERYAPRYRQSLVVYIIAEALSILLMLYMGWSLAQDRRRRLLELQDGTKEGHIIELQDEDLTDRQDIHFVYKP
ncbi:major facilitator superfamily domain-containing protein [Fennellomyces sp. T-0311]|nr:major facilitator superfamily domain-containing protein [Fennellomyces sp. T-0311]